MVTYGPGGPRVCPLFGGIPAPIGGGAATPAGEALNLWQPPAPPTGPAAAALADAGPGIGWGIGAAGVCGPLGVDPLWVDPGSYRIG